jgi:hypothetical protein
MAPPDAQAAASYGCSAVLSYCLRGFQVPIDWGQSIYHLCPTHEKSVPRTEPRGADRPEAILYPTSRLIKGSVRFDDRFETAHPSPNRF